MNFSHSEIKDSWISSRSNPTVHSSSLCRWAAKWPLCGLFGGIAGTCYNTWCPLSRPCNCLRQWSQSQSPEWIFCVMFQYISHLDPSFRLLLGMGMATPRRKLQFKNQESHCHWAWMLHNFSDVLSSSVSSLFIINLFAETNNWF